MNTDITVAGVVAAAPIATVHWQIDGGLEQVAAGAEASFRLPSGGTYSVTAFTRDELGFESAPVTETFIVDADAPIVTPNADPAPNAAGWNDTDVTVTFTAIDPSGLPVTCDQAVVVTSEGAGLEVSGSCEDALGNIGSASITLNVDKTAPAVTAGENQRTNEGTEVAFIGGANDALTEAGQLQSVWTFGLGGDVEVGTLTPSYTFVDGPEVVRVELAVTDLAGNVGTDALFVTVDNVAPQVDLGLDARPPRACPSPVPAPSPTRAPTPGPRPSTTTTATARWLWPSR